MGASKVKEYIGDGVYAEFDEYGDIILTAEDGITIKDQIILEPAVFLALVAFEDKARISRWLRLKAEKGSE